MSALTTKWYLPLLNGEPARFDGDQFCYVDQAEYAGDRTRSHALLLRDLRTLLRQAAAHRKYRDGRRWEVGRLSYCIVEVPRG